MAFDPARHPRGGSPTNSGQFSRVPRREASIELKGAGAHADGGWPSHRYAVRAWNQTNRAGTREDRQLREITVVLPPDISQLIPPIDSVLAAVMEDAMREITALDNTHGESLESLGVLLLRTESVASSKIEYVNATMDEYARALHGIKTNSSAVSMVAATDALDSMIGMVEHTRHIDIATLTTAHAALMGDDPREKHYAGRLRDVQNWIGGSDHSPRGALYVPPPPETVVPYMNDLLVFANRDDLPVLTQAAIAHAQFESIHPFTDGNGRIGRALINTILRRRAATTRVVVPLASALVAHRDRYFDLLGSYRRGDIHPLITTFAESSRIAAAESRVTASRLESIPAQWQDAVGSVRAGSAGSRLLALLPTRPILSAEDACEAIGAASSAVYKAIERLASADVLRPLTDRKRNQVWGAGLILDELDDLGVRIALAAR